MKIIVDAMGGDNAPDEIVAGAVKAAQVTDFNITLTGIPGEIQRVTDKLKLNKLPENLEIAEATQVIGFDEDPTTAIRTKKDSSLTVSFNLLKNGQGDALVSAGSTGALLAGATLIVKRVRGIRRAALAPVIPSKTGGFVLIDCGANTECTPEYLIQFAYMGSLYASQILESKPEHPRVGLLNNGTEETKGTSLQLEVFHHLKKADINFIGNLEAKDALKGGCDVLVCDGFTGNIMLKTIEGTASLVMSELKSALMSSTVSKIGALLAKSRMSELRKKLDPDAVGGTALLGIEKPVIKAHGSSGADAIYNAIFRAANEVKWDIAAKLREITF